MLRAWVIGCLLLGASSCGVVANDCTLIGCEASLTVRYAPVPEPGTAFELSWAGRTETRVCGVDFRCERGAVEFWGVSPPQAWLRVVGQGIDTTFFLVPEYETFRPNGPSCEPACQMVTVAIDLNR